jgi:hypothetical protein
LDVGKAAEGLDRKLWQLDAVDAADLEQMFAYRISPAADKKKPL